MRTWLPALAILIAGCRERATARPDAAPMPSPPSTTPRPRCVNASLSPDAGSPDPGDFSFVVEGDAYAEDPAVEAALDRGLCRELLVIRDCLDRVRGEQKMVPGTFDLEITVGPDKNVHNAAVVASTFMDPEYRKCSTQLLAASVTTPSVRGRYRITVRPLPPVAMWRELRKNAAPTVTALVTSRAKKTAACYDGAHAGVIALGLELDGKGHGNGGAIDERFTTVSDEKTRACVLRVFSGDFPALPDDKSWGTFIYPIELGGAP